MIGGIAMDVESVRGILAGRKDQTRRAIELPSVFPDGVDVVEQVGETWWAGAANGDFPVRCPYRPGLYYVKEPLIPKSGAVVVDPTSRAARVTYRADGSFFKRGRGGKRWPWKARHIPAMYCPRWASRITLEVLEIRAERVQDISDEDALAEGLECDHDPDSGYWYAIVRTEHGVECKRPRHAFEDRWQGINGKREGCTWADNPWVWVVAFRRVEA